MCLSSIYRTEIITEPVTAWKVFEKHEGEKEYFSLIVGFISLPDVWIEAIQRNINIGIRWKPEYVTYKSGFHCFLSKESAVLYANQMPDIYIRNAVIMKVKLKGQMTYGRDHCHDAVVGTEMYIDSTSPPVSIKNPLRNVFYRFIAGIRSLVHRRHRTARA